jgi:hypothetical protein
MSGKGKSPTNTAATIAAAANAAAHVNNARRAAEAAAASSAPPATNASPVVAASTSSLPTSSSSAANAARATPTTSASVAATAPVVAAAANAAANAKEGEICFIYSNALTKGTFKKGCIIVYKGDKSSPDHSAEMVKQLVAQKDLQVVQGGLQKSFVQPVDDKTSLFIAYVEVINAPSDEQIKTMKATISQALPKKGGKRFHTKKRHAKKRTTRRS